MSVIVHPPVTAEILIFPLSITDGVYLSFSILEFFSWYL